jgi:hypothetical protein
MHRPQLLPAGVRGLPRRLIIGSYAYLYVTQPAAGVNHDAGINHEYRFTDKDTQ